MNSFDNEDDDDVDTSDAVTAAQSLVSGTAVDVGQWQLRQQSAGKLIAVSDLGACRRWCQAFPKSVLKQLFIRWGIEDNYRESFNGRQPIPWLLDTRFTDGISYADMAEMDLVWTMMKGRVGTKRWHRGTLDPFPKEQLKYPNFEALSQRLGIGFSSFFPNYTTSDYYNGQLWVRITSMNNSHKVFTFQAGSADNVAWESVDAGSRRKQTFFLVFFPNSSTFFASGFKIQEKEVMLQVVSEIYGAKSAKIELMGNGTLQDLADLVLRGEAQGRVRQFRPENDVQTNPLLRGASAATAAAGRKRTRSGRLSLGGAAGDEGDDGDDGDDIDGDSVDTFDSQLPGGRRKGGGRRSRQVDPVKAALEQEAAAAAARIDGLGSAIRREDRGLRQRRAAAASQAFGAAAGQQPAIGQFEFSVKRPFTGQLLPGSVQLENVSFGQAVRVRLRGTSVLEGVRNALVRGMIHAGGDGAIDAAGFPAGVTPAPFDRMFNFESQTIELK